LKLKLRITAIVLQGLLAINNYAFEYVFITQNNRCYYRLNQKQYKEKYANYLNVNKEHFYHL